MGSLLVIDGGCPSVRLARKTLLAHQNVILVPPERAEVHIQAQPYDVIAPVTMIGGPVWDHARDGGRVAYGFPEDMERALLLGADDYLCAPWTAIELFVRVYRLTERGKDTFGRVLTFGDTTVVLSDVQAAIWRTLHNRAGRVVSREILADAAGLTDDGTGKSRALDMHIARLRRVLGTDWWRIETIRGRGYLLTDEKVNFSNSNVDK